MNRNETMNQHFPDWMTVNIPGVLGIASLAVVKLAELKDLVTIIIMILTFIVSSTCTILITRKKLRAQRPVYTKGRG